MIKKHICNLAVLFLTSYVSTPEYEIEKSAFLIYSGTNQNKLLLLLKLRDYMDTHCLDDTSFCVSMAGTHSFIGVKRKHVKYILLSHYDNASMQ